MKKPPFHLDRMEPEASTRLLRRRNILNAYIRFKLDIMSRIPCGWSTLGSMVLVLLLRSFGGETVFVRKGIILYDCRYSQCGNVLRQL